MDTARWVYTYDSLGQVISGKKYWSDGTAVAGQHFEYAFDTIGNRQSTKAGGDNDGANLQSATYAVNTLNQYTNRTVPGYVNVLGTASNNATVTLWGDTSLYAPTIRKGEYFRGELSVNNATGAVWLTITNVAVLNNGANPDIVTNTTGNVLLAKTPETFKYDTDGNLTSDSLWTNTWNGENRRMTIESRSDAPSPAKHKEQWTHLADGRWIERIVSTWNGSSYVESYTNRYVWDAQVLLAVLDHTNGLVVGFMRGLDLSGSLQGAGGVGGVLAATFKTNGTHFFCYDGNGNVSALVAATDGLESARYEHGPFAEPIRMTGPMAKLNPIRFSTQYANDVTGDLKYLFRDYDTDSGRWLSRDPISEAGGINVYSFVLNRPISHTDTHGLFANPSLFFRLFTRCRDKCGPDVTTAMNNTLSVIETFFDGLPSDQARRDVCESLYDNRAGAAWDVTPLKNAGMGDSSPFQGKPSTGTGECKRTVVYNGKCVFAGSLNYMAFGKMNQLCNGAINIVPPATSGSSGACRTIPKRFVNSGRGFPTTPPVASIWSGSVGRTARAARVARKRRLGLCKRRSIAAPLVAMTSP